MDTNPIIPAAWNSSIDKLQRIQPATNSERRRGQTPKRRKPNPNAKYSNEVLYKPDGQVESEEQGVRVDVSA